MPLRRIREALTMLERIDYHVRTHSTGTPDEFAEKLGVSRSTWFDYLQILIEDLDFPIQYDTYLKSYIYTYEGKFIIKFIKE